MQTYNAIVRLNAELTNEVPKTNLTTPEVLLLRKIHGEDAVVDITPSGQWEDHFSKRKVKDGLGQEIEEEVEYDDEDEKDRLAAIYGDALLEEADSGIARRAINRIFGDYAPLPSVLKEFKDVAKAAKPAKKGNLDKVA